MFRLLRVDVSDGDWWVEELDGVAGPLDAGVVMHSKVYRSWACGALDECNAVIFGFGPFSVTRLFGSNRVTFVFKSPLSGGLHASSLGGAAWAMARSGVDGIAVEGAAAEPVVVVVEGREGSLARVRVEPASGMVREAFKEGRGRFGVFRMHELVASRYRDLLSRGQWRILAVGPAAAFTLAGGVFSIPIEAGRFTPVVDSASRGGGGSVLFRAHRVAAMVVGGTGSPGRPRSLLDRAWLDSASREALGHAYPQAVLVKTKKYRFDPKLGTGGTFGVNYVVYKELVPSLAYNTIYYSHTVRARLHEMIMEHFWRPFQEEVFRGSPAGKWRTCGEPCPVACKKIWRGVKVDYEPFQGMGPLIGVLDLGRAARLVELADSLGIDAIEAGHLVAWVFDVLQKRLLHPSEAGLAAAPNLDPLTLDPAADSERNAALAEALLRDIAYARGPLGGVIAERGLRGAARAVEEEHGTGPGGLAPRDLAVYAAFGADGYMTPNYYWSPGMVAPLYVLGRYWTNYAPTFMEPEDYAEHSLKRAVWEYALDNAGVCRFHRGWAEALLPRLYSEAVGVDPAEHAARMYAEIEGYQESAGAEPVPWESRKTVDLVASIAAEVGSTEWAKRIASSPDAAREWWTRFYSHLKRLIAGGA